MWQKLLHVYPGSCIVTGAPRAPAPSVPQLMCRDKLSFFSLPLSVLLPRLCAKVVVFLSPFCNSDYNNKVVRRQCWLQKIEIRKTTTFQCTLFKQRGRKNSKEFKYIYQLTHHLTLSPFWKQNMKWREQINEMFLWTGSAQQTTLLRNAVLIINRH